MLNNLISEHQTMVKIWEIVILKFRSQNKRRKNFHNQNLLQIHLVNRYKNLHKKLEETQI
jgi:hypothetical protein